jgi:hypothetical protein
MSYFETTSIKAADSASVDAFGRLRVSNPLTIFDSKQCFDDPDLANSVENFPLFFDNQEISGGSTTTTFDLNAAKTTLAVGATTAGRRVRQTKMRFNYQPGKSELVLNTFVFSSANATGITRRIGIYDDNNGIFFDDNGTNYGFVVRSYVTGSPVDTRIAKADWNVDPMDGTGPSGIILDFTKTKILVIDFECLGVGRVRIGWNVIGNTYLAHQFLNTNNLSDVYMSTPNLPLRAEIINSGAGAASSLATICSSVVSEGGAEDLGAVRSASTNGTHVDANTEDVIYAILGIKLKSSHLGATVKLVDFTLLEAQGGKKLEWMLLLNPTVASTFTYAAESQSAVEIARGATANTVTGGYRLAGGLFESGSATDSGSAGEDLHNAILLGSTIAGVADAMVLCVRPIAGSTNTDIEGTIAWREIR